LNDLIPFVCNWGGPKSTVETSGSAEEKWAELGLPEKLGKALHRFASF